MGGQDVGEGPEQLLVCERAVTPFPPFRKESGDNRFQAFEGRTEFRQAVQAEVEKTRRVFFLDNKQVIRSSSDACGRGGSAPRLSDNGVLFQISETASGPQPSDGHAKDVPKSRTSLPPQ